MEGKALEKMTVKELREEAEARSSLGRDPNGNAPLRQPSSSPGSFWEST